MTYGAREGQRNEWGSSASCLCSGLHVVFTLDRQIDCRRCKSFYTSLGTPGGRTIVATWVADCHTPLVTQPSHPPCDLRTSRVLVSSACGSTYSLRCGSASVAPESYPAACDFKSRPGGRLSRMRFSSAPPDKISDSVCTL